jgi:hypothetical protein
VYQALLPLTGTPRLPVVDRTDAPCHFKLNRPFCRKTKTGCCACAITFQTQSTLFLTRSVQLLFYTFLQHYGSNLSTSFWSPSRSIPTVSIHKKQHLKCNISLVPFLNLSLLELQLMYISLLAKSYYSQFAVCSSMRGLESSSWSQNYSSEAHG